MKSPMTDPKITQISEDEFVALAQRRHNALCAHNRQIYEEICAKVWADAWAKVEKND